MPRTRAALADGALFLLAVGILFIYRDLPGASAFTTYDPWHRLSAFEISRARQMAPHRGQT